MSEIAHDAIAEGLIAGLRNAIAAAEARATAHATLDQHAEARGLLALATSLRSKVADLEKERTARKAANNATDS